MNNQTQEAVELCTFKLNEGSDTSDFEASNKEVDAWINQQEGFKYRSLSQKEDGSWIDIVYWDSMAAAQKAGESFMSVLGTSKFMALIDQESVCMNHSAVKFEALAEYLKA